MRLKDHGNSILVWLSANDTYQWACKPGATWPCSTLSGKRVFAAFDSNGLYDIAINGNSYIDCDGTEFSAIMADHIKTCINSDHELYFVTVGQFE
jgi:hypothetical protein